MRESTFIPHNRPTLDTEEIDAVARVLKSKWLIAETEVKKFENAIKEYLHTPFALALSSGHAALHLALLAMGVKEGDRIIVPSYTVTDVLNAISYVHATTVLVDVAEQSVNMDMDQVLQKIDKKTKAVIVPHMFGIPAKIDSLQNRGIAIIEDAAQALGTFYKRKPLGSFGDMGVLSFYASKIITTGQGGMLVTNNSDYYNFAKDKIDYNAPRTYAVRYNYPLTDIAASIGRVQLKKLPEFLRRRKKIGALYQEIGDKKGIAYLPKKSDRESNYFRFILLFSNKTLRDNVQKRLKKEGIHTVVPLKDYETLHVILKQNRTDFPNTEHLTATALSLPIYPSLTNNQIARIVQALNTCL